MVIIRQYQKEDKESVWALHNEALTAVGAHGGNGKWDDDLHHIEEIYLRDRGEFAVVVFGNDLVAMGALKQAGRDLAEIKRMRVKPQFQRQGLGRSLLLHLEQRALELGFSRLCLETTTRQESAQHLYRNHGYLETGRKRVGSFETILFEKEIGEQGGSGKTPSVLG